MATKSYTQTIIDELYNTNTKAGRELADILHDNRTKGMSDKEVRQYINSSRGYYSKIWPQEMLNDMPTFRKSLYSEPAMNTVKDLDKAFNDPNWDVDYINGNIPEDQLDFIAEENGISKERLKELMNAEANRRDRARDMEMELSPKGVQNFITRAMFPRSTERYLKGDEIQGKDIGFDAAENLLYMMPYGVAASALAKGSRPAKLLLTGVSNAVNPAITETADALVYSDDNDNERSVFQPADVVKGTLVNMATPYALLRGAGTTARRYGLPEGAAKWVEEYGTGTTARDLKNQWIKDVKMVNEQRLNPNSTPLKQKLDSKSVIESKDYKASLPEGHQNILTGEESLNGIIYQPGKNFDEKLANYNKNTVNKIKKGTPEYERLASEYEMWVPPEQIIQAENLKATEDIIMQEMLKNYLTNKAGDLMYSDQPDKLPLVGRLFRKSPKTLKEEQEAKEYEDQLNYLYDKYKLPDYREAK